MRIYHIIICRNPPDHTTRKYYDYSCETMTKAWEYARRVARECGPVACVVSVVDRGEYAEKAIDQGKQAHS